MKFIQIHQFYCTLPVLCDPSLWRLQTALCARLLNNSSGHWKTTVLGKLRSDLKKENPHTYSNLPSEGEAFPATPNTSKSIIFVLKFQEPVKSQSREGRVKCSSINIFPSRRKGANVTLPNSSSWCQDGSISVRAAGDANEQGDEWAGWWGWVGLFVSMNAS